ncbi:MAG: ribonuclease H-like domain-containing protein, partial [Cyanobacteria bacterium J06633_23]
LDTILRYNEDDCRATYRVKDWLVKFAQPFW